MASTGSVTGWLLSFPVEESAESRLEEGGNEDVMILPSSAPPCWTLTLGRRGGVGAGGLWVKSPRAELAHPPFLLGGQRAGPGGLHGANPPCAQAVEGGEAGASQEPPPRPSPPGGRCPVLPQPPACCLRGAGPVPPGRVPSGSFPLPSHPLVQRLRAEGSHMVLCGTRSPGYSLFPGRCRLGSPVSWPPLPPHCLLPHSRPERRLWGPGSPSRGALPSQDEQGSLLGSATHTLRENC